MTQFQFAITGPDVEMTVELPLGATVIGRDASSEIVIDHPRILRRHFRFEVSEDDVHVIPLNRRSRLKHNGDTIPPEIPTELSVGDRIQFGPFMGTLGVATVEEVVVEAVEEGGSAETEPDDYTETPEPAPAGGGTPPSANLPDFLRFAPPPPPDYTHQIPAGLGRHSVRYINYLPQIYHTDFTSRFIALIEALYMPILWQVENFDFYLDVKTMPPHFLNWVAGWFGISFDSTWTVEQRRSLIREAHTLYPRRGTKKALERLLEIYTGRTPEILDLQDDQDPFTFTVKLPVRERDVNRQLVERLIEANKPAHTTYTLEFSSRVDLDTVLSHLDF